MEYYVAISESETDDPIEVPVENDGGVLLSSVQSQFPSAVGLKFRNPSNRAFRGVRLADGVLYPPEGGWGDTVYLVNTVKTQTDNKRKMEDSAQAEVSKTKRPTPQASDLVVLNLPYHYTKENLAEFFSKYGELSFTQIMKNTEGLSRGFGFIRFVNYDDQKRVNGAAFVIDGRKVQVKKPNSQSPELCRVFVGRLTDKISKEDLMEHFEQFGPVSEIYYDQGRKQFAFVTFEESCMADRAIAEKSHYIREIHVVVRPADPMDKNKQQQQQQNSAAHSQPKLASFYNPSMAATNHYPNVKTEYSPGSPSYDGYSQIASTGNGLNCSYNGAAGGVGQMNKSPHYSNQAPHYLNQAPMSPPGQTIDPGTFGQEMLNAMAKMMATAMTGSFNAQSSGSNQSNPNSHMNGINGGRMNPYEHHRLPQASSAMQPSANIPARYSSNIPNPYKSPPHDPYSNMY